MKKIIYSSKFVKYNANVRNKNIGDCVRRSISLAFNKSYNQVVRDLNKVLQDYPKGYNYGMYPIYSKVIDKYGGSKRRKVRDITEYTVTVGQFADLVNGTYLVECASNAGEPDHLVCIIDHNVYDSWNSLDDIAMYYYVVENVEHGTSDIKSQEYQILEQLDDFARDCLYRFTKSTNQSESITFMNEDIDIHTLSDVRNDYMYIQIQLEPNSRYLDDYNLDIICKFTPFEKSEQFIEDSQKLIYRKIYFFIRKLKKDIEDAQEVFNKENESYVDSTDTEDLYLVGLNKRVYNTLPSWCKPLIQFISARRGSYVLEIRPLPSDSNKRNYTILAKDRKELEEKLLNYKDSYERL